jgi:hypothetical protein
MVSRTLNLVLVLAGGLALALPSRADEWDVGNDADNTFTTDNTLVHGSEQIHDLERQVLPNGVITSDHDWFLLPAHPFSSYEFLVDGMTGDVGLKSGSVSRWVGAGTMVVQVADTLPGGVLSLNWLGLLFPVSQDQWVQITGADCGASCDANDRYRARFYDTTYTIPRFNTTGGQTTVLFLRNASARTCSGYALAVAADALSLKGIPLDFTPGQLLVFNLGELVPDKSGSVRIVHTCGYGGLSGKAVSIEPATGFTFDTEMVARPR